MDGFKKRYRWIVILAVLLLAGAYMARVIQVNQKYGKSSTEYLPDRAFKTWDGLEISMEEEKLYNIAAFLDKYPAAQRYYQYAGSIYEAYNDEEGIRDIENILCVEMKVRNLTEESRVIDPSNQYRLYSGAYGSGLTDYRVFEEVNQIGAALELRAGAEVSFLLCYDLNKKSFRKGSYEDLLERKFSILVHNFPDMQYITLEHLEYVAADEDAVSLYEQLVSADDSADPAVREDTQRATLLPLGGEYVTGGLCVSCDSIFVAYDNVHDYEGFDESMLPAILREETAAGQYSGAVDEEGNIMPMWSAVSQAFSDYKPSVVFVTLNLYNSSSRKKNIQKIYPYLYFYIGKNLNDVEMLPYTTCENVEITKTISSTSYEMEGYARGKITFAYYCVENDDYGVNLQSDPLWIDFNDTSVGKVNLKKGNPGKGIFMRIQ